MARKQCAVCGDTCSTNVRLAWRRDRDGKKVNVCCLCAESGKVNADSIDNFTGKATEYVASENRERKNARMHSYYFGKSHLGGGKARGRMAKIKD